MTVFFSLAALALIFFIVRDKVRNAERNGQLAKLRQYPVRSFPFIGHGWYFVGPLSRIQHLIKDALTNLETPFVIWLGYIPAVMLSKVEDVEEVSRECSNRTTYGFADEIFGNGIVFHDFTKWKKSRRMMTPAFGPAMLTQYVEVFNEQSKVLVDILQQKATTGEIFDLEPFLFNASVETATENMMGIQAGCQTTQGNEYSRSIMRLLQAVIRRVANPLLHPDPIFKTYIYLTGLTEDLDRMKKLCKQAINKSLKNHVDIAEGTSLSGAENTSKHMIDILAVDRLKDPESMTEKQLTHEMVQMVIAGTETTAITVGSLILLYGMHQDEQELVYQEILSIIPKDRPVTIEDLKKFQYLDKTIKETLRLWIPVPITIRTLQNAITLKSGETIPGDDTCVLINLQGMLENPEYYPNPKRWNPENFNAEAIAARPANSFAPFGLGPRACIGSKYAMLSVKVQTIYLLRKYRIFTDMKLEDIIIEQDLVNRSRHGYRIRLQKRES